MARGGGQPCELPGVTPGYPQEAVESLDGGLSHAEIADPLGKRDPRPNEGESAEQNTY